MATQLPPWLFGSATGPANARNTATGAQEQEDRDERELLVRIANWDGKTVEELDAITDDMLRDHRYVRKERSEHDRDDFHVRFELVDAANALLDRKDTPLYHKAQTYMILAYMSEEDPVLQLSSLRSAHIHLEQLERETRVYQEEIDDRLGSDTKRDLLARRWFGIEFSINPKDPFARPDLSLDTRPAGVRKEVLALFEVLENAVAEVGTDSEVKEEDTDVKGEEAGRADAGATSEQEAIEAGPKHESRDYEARMAVDQQVQTGKDTIKMEDVPAITIQTDHTKDPEGPVQKASRSPMPSFLHPHGAAAEAKLDTSTSVGDGGTQSGGVWPFATLHGESRATEPVEESSSATESLSNLRGPESGYPNCDLRP